MQFALALDWGREPWNGVSPRYLTKGYPKIGYGTCVVDKSEVGCPSREAHDEITDAAQFTMFLKGTPNGT